MDTGYTVGDAMTKMPVVVSPDDSIIKCSKIMDDHHVGALIVKKGDILTGIVTEQDIVREAIAKDRDTNEAIESIMEKKVETINPSEDIYKALVKMRDLNIRHLPVLGEGTMVGLLTLKDILKIQPQLFDLLIDKFELREEERKPVATGGICEACGEFTLKLYSNEDSLKCKSCR